MITKSILQAKDLAGKERFSFLKANKELMLAEKKAVPVKFTDDATYMPSLYQVEKEIATKTAFGSIPENADVVRVKVVANACWFMDSQFDVLIDDSAKRSIENNKSLIKHLRDHEYKINAEVGDVQDIYLEDIMLTELGWNGKGKTQCVIFETDIRKDYDEGVFKKYRDGKINQHSIGLQYKKIDMAIYYEDDEKEIDFWNKYYPKIINKDVADQYGFFFVVSEYKLLENSAVILGSNSLTPTLEVSSTKTLPPKSTENFPHFDLSKAIAETKFN